ncbi:MAG: lytic transglycosylase domain-containing protein [Ferruginibacter sp.]
MKIRFVKALTVFSLLFLQTRASAGSALPLTDTSKKTLLATNEIKSLYLVCEATVEYPAEIEMHREASISYVKTFSEKRRNYLLKTFNASPYYVKKATRVFDTYAVPPAFCLLMALESGFTAHARSSAGAVGYWQFMDDVAREYGLKTAHVQLQKKTITRKGKKVIVTKKITTTDERMNFAKSTNAAARYLKDRMRNLNNDWLLVAASYNWGIGNVWDAMKRCGKENPGFWDIKAYLPAETRAYVMNFITLNVIAHNYQKFLVGTLTFEDVYSDTPDQARLLNTAPAVLVD